MGWLSRQSRRGHRRAGPRVRQAARSRRGAILSAEMLLVFPVLIIVLFGIIEISLLISTTNQLKLASNVGARVCATTPGPCDAAVELAINQVLGNSSTFDNVSVTCDDDGVSGGLCTITLTMPKTDAAPDLLGVLGLKLEGTLQQSTTMRKE